MATAVDAQITAQARLRAITARAAVNAWDALPNHDEEGVAPFLAVVVPIILAAQRWSITLSDAYVARALRRRPLGIDPTPVIAGLRGATTPEEVYRRPFVTTWSGLRDGKPFEEAVGAGRARVESSVELDVQMAHRAGLQAVQAADARIRGWARRADPGACEFCRLINGAKVLHADAMPLHNRCGCGLEPLTVLVEADPLPAGVAVHDHGEYGPTLGDPSHDHLAPAEALDRQ